MAHDKRTVHPGIALNQGRSSRGVLPVFGTVICDPSFGKVGGVTCSQSTAGVWRANRYEDAQDHISRVSEQSALFKYFIETPSPYT
jgi:hypothetical protein